MIAGSGTVTVNSGVLGFPITKITIPNSAFCSNSVYAAATPYQIFNGNACSVSGGPASTSCGPSNSNYGHCTGSLGGSCTGPNFSAPVPAVKINACNKDIIVSKSGACSPAGQPNIPNVSCYNPATTFVPNLAGTGAFHAGAGAKICLTGSGHPNPCGGTSPTGVFSPFVPMFPGQTYSGSISTGYAGPILKTWTQWAAGWNVGTVKASSTGLGLNTSPKGYQSVTTSTFISSVPQQNIKVSLVSPIMVKFPATLTLGALAVPSHADITLTIPCGNTCGNNVVEACEECDDGNNSGGDCCSASCQYESNGSTCGDDGTECTNQDLCDGAGSCSDNGFQSAATDCGDAGTECINQDKCDGAGSCSDNGFQSAATDCGDAGTECINQDKCDGAGSCSDNGFQSAATDCGGAGTECINQDKCDGAGSCSDNGFQSFGTDCGDAGTECINQDECNGAGTCTDNGFKSAATDCGDTGTECINQDKCDGAGSCDDNGFVNIGTNCGSAGDGVCDLQDLCDGSGSCLDTIALGGNAVTCGDTGTECIVQDYCDGAGSCSDNGFQSSGTDCGDAGTECINQDQCDGAGSCSDNGFAAADTACTADANPCNFDTCDGAGACAAEEPVCTLTGEKSGLGIKEKGAKSQLKWKLGKGAAVDQAGLGDPTTTTAYTLCVYDETADAATLATSLSVPASATKWQSKDPKGLQYKDKGGTADGVTKIKLKTGVGGKTKAQVQAKGANLPLPTAFSTTEFFDQDTKVRVQLLNSANQTCWQSDFTTAKKNTDTLFKAKAP